MASKQVGQQYRKAYQDMTGGLSTRSSPLQIPANKFAKLQNAILNDRDILEKAEGYVLDGSPFPNSTDSFIRMLVNYKVGSAVNTLVCAAADAGNTNATYKVDLKQSYGNGSYAYIGHTTGTALFTHSSAVVTGTSTFWNLHLKAGDKIGTGAAPSVWYEIQSVDSATQVTLTSVYAGTTTLTLPYMARIILSINSLPVGVVFNNKLIISNGSETPMETNNTTLNKLQSANWSAVKYLALHKNRVFGANWSASTSGLLWTAANDETTVDSASKTTVFTNDNGEIVSIISFANSLLVFKNNGIIYQIVGEFDQDAVGQPAMVRKIDVPDNIGGIAGRSVCILEDNSGVQGYQRLGSKVYFLSETGVYTINSYMQVQKVSWEIQSTLSSLLLNSTTSASKTYSFSSKSQWDAGTINSLSDTRVASGLSTFFDSLSLSGASQSNGAVSTYMDTSNNAHTAYIASVGNTVRYNHWLASDNTNVDSQVLSMGTDSILVTENVASGPYCVAVASAPNSKVGILSKWFASNGVNYVYIFSELSSGAWTHTKLENSGTYESTDLGVSVLYDASSEPAVMYTQASGATSGFTYIKRTAGTWGTASRHGQGTAYSAGSMFVDGSLNIHLALAATGRVFYYKSTDAGVNFTNPNTITVSGSSPLIGAGHVDITVNANSEPIIVYGFTGGSGGDVGKIVRYNCSTSSSSYLDSSTSVLKGYSNTGGNTDITYLTESGTEVFKFETTYTGGTASFTNGSKTVTGTNTNWSVWVQSGDRIKLGSDVEADYGTVDTVNSATSITLLANYAGSSTGSPAAYVAKRSNSVAAGGSTILDNTHRASNALSQNGSAVTAVSFGANAGEIRLRRVTLFGQWYSGSLSDSTLTSWSTYDVANPVTSGNTILYEVGTNSSSPVTDDLMASITPGAVISTGTNIYVKARISFTLVVFAASSIDSLVLNFLGTGIDAKIPTAYVFNNEMYMSVTSASSTGNDEVVFLDHKGAWGLFTTGTCAMARYNKQLYIGSSSSGKIYKFRQGFNASSAAYSLIAISKEDLLGSIELQKEIYKVYVIYETQLNGNFTFSYRFDNFLNANSSDTTGWVDQTIDHTVGAVTEITGMSGQKCSSIQFKIEQASADVQVGIVGFIVLYDYYNLR